MNVSELRPIRSLAFTTRASLSYNFTIHTSVVCAGWSSAVYSNLELPEYQRDKLTCLDRVELPARCSLNPPGVVDVMAPPKSPLSPSRSSN